MCVCVCKDVAGCVCMCQDVADPGGCQCGLLHCWGAVSCLGMTTHFDLEIVSLKASVLISLCQEFAVLQAGYCNVLVGHCSCKLAHASHVSTLHQLVFKCHMTSKQGSHDPLA